MCDLDRVKITMATPGKLSKKERKKQIQAKTSISSPYQLTWTPLPHNNMHYILELLIKSIKDVGLEKKEVKGPRPWSKRKDKVRQISQEEIKVQGPLEMSCQSGWTDKSARRQLAIGINEVTKALERNELRLVLVCKSAQPPHMTSNLIALSKTRDVPACQVPRLSESVSGLLGLRSVLALGFRRGDGQRETILSDTVDAIISKVPPLMVPWLPDMQPSDTGKCPIEEDACEGKGQKRKLEYEMAESAPCALQPLKIKKIVPNPSKRRKVKRKTIV